MPLTCSSQVSKVTVHARGALVTRRVQVPAPLPEGDVELLVPGLTILAEGGSLRASVPAGSRTLVSVRSHVVVPATPAVAGAPLERVQALAERIQRLRSEQALRGARRDRLLPRTPDARFRELMSAGQAAARTADALAAAALLDEAAARLDLEGIAIEQTLRDVERELEAAQLEAAQATSGERMGQGHPTRQAAVLLTGAGPLADLDLVYAVPAARWWPVYTLRIAEGGRRAAWWIEALVAQCTGEDWAGVELALSTADLVFDARLPELASLRLGRAQPPARKAYRPPPPGLDRMFEAFDRGFGAPVPKPVSTRTATFQTLDAAPARAEEMDRLYAADGATSLAQEFGSVLMEAEERPAPEALASMAYDAPALPAGVAFELHSPPPPAMPMSRSAPFAPPPTRAPMAKGRSRRQEEQARDGRGPAPEPGGSDIEPGEAWLDFDALTLSAPGQPRRGRLVRQEASGALEKRVATEQIEKLAPAPELRDPWTSRGMFDHRYAVDGLAEVPSDALAHRVMVGTAETAPTLRWRTVPREAPEVYREAELRNPFDAPLLAGPVDVYVEGSLLAATTVGHVDRGGSITVGMGVEERIRVARNVRTEEAPPGLFGLSTVVTHTVTLELSSALGRPALVEVIDRVPVTDDKALEVEVLSAQPEPEAYTQAERGAAVRGGRRWKLVLPAGGREAVELTYRLTFPSRSEIVGGNRRD